MNFLFLAYKKKRNKKDKIKKRKQLVTMEEEEDFTLCLAIKGNKQYTEKREKKNR